MIKRIYQYSLELKKWIFLTSMQCTGKLEIPWFEKGSFCYEIHLYSITGVWNENFLNNVKTKSISYCSS